MYSAPHAAPGHPCGKGPLRAALGGPEWSFLELPTGHWPMFSVPDRLAALLGELEIAGGDAEAVAGR